MTRTPIHRLGLLSLGLLASTPAADVWSVRKNDPTADFDEVQAAIDAASSGDTILVGTGLYDAFEIDGESLRVVREVAASPTVRVPSSGALVRVRNLAPGQSVTLRGFDLGIDQVFTPVVGIDLVDNQGSVWIEEFEVEMHHPFVEVFDDLHAIQAAACASVVLVDCDVRGHRSSQGLSATDSAVFAYRSVFRGGPGGFDSFANDLFSAGHGAELDGGSLFASGCSFTGGTGLTAPTPCTPSNSDGGDGVLLHGSAPSLHELDSVFTPGLGGQASIFCPTSTPGADGIPIRALTGSSTSLAETARFVSLNTPVREGELLTQSFTGSPNDLVFAVVSLQPANGVLLPAFFGALVLGVPQSTFVLGSLDGSGAGSVSVTLGELGAGVDAVSLNVLPVFFDVVDSLVVLGGPSTALLLDAAL